MPDLQHLSQVLVGLHGLERDSASINDLSEPGGCAGYSFDSSSDYASMSISSNDDIGLMKISVGERDGWLARIAS